MERRQYTKEEDLKILQCVKRAGKKKGLIRNDFWIQLQEKGVLPNRSWESMRGRYTKIIRYKGFEQCSDLEKDEHADSQAIPPTPFKNSGAKNDQVSPSRLEHDGDRSEDEMSEVYSLVGEYQEIEETEGEIKQTKLESKEYVNSIKAPDMSASICDEMIQSDRHMTKHIENGVRASDESKAARNSGVLNMILGIRSQTQATLLQIIFSLFRTNANMQYAIAFLNDKDTTNVWTVNEDKILASNNETHINKIIAKRGLEAVQKRTEFLAMQPCDVQKGS